MKSGENPVARGDQFLVAAIAESCSLGITDFKRGKPPADVEEMETAAQPEPLGSAKTVRESISRYLPEVDWSDPTWGVYATEEFSIEFNMGSDDPIDSIMLHIRGGGDAIAAILQFAHPNKWSLFDCSTSEFIDPENPSHQGWEGFQSFRDQVFDEFQADDDLTS